MTDSRSDDTLLLVASRGDEAGHGLWLFGDRNEDRAGRQLDHVPHLSALTGHPHLPVVYGCAGADAPGTVHAWRIDGTGEAILGTAPSGGVEPCHLAVDPSGTILVVANYVTGTLSLQRLGADGSFDGPADLVTLTGSGPDPDRQESAHPHQVIFDGDFLYVIDLGADLIRTFSVDPSRPGADALTEGAATPTPPGTGPRHGVLLPDGRFAISGELSETLLTGRPGVGDWSSVRSTRQTGPGRARWERNYPGDIRLSPDGAFAYVANRSHGTLATFDLRGEAPGLVDEIDTGLDWPQHILVERDRLLIAGWDSNRVATLPMIDGIPEPPETLFTCAAPAWLHLHRRS